MNEYDKVSGDFADNYDNESTDYLNLDPNVQDASAVPNTVEEPEDNLEDNSEVEESEEEPNGNRGQKKYSVQEAFQIAQREKYNAIAENERLKQEVNRLKTVSDQSAEAALRHYEENVTNRLNRANAMFEVAEERGDIEAKKYAIKEMQDANFAVNELNRWKADQQANHGGYEEQYQQQQYQPERYQGYTPEPQRIHSTREMEAQAAANGHNWVAKNTWFSEGSPDYDPQLAAIAMDISYKMQQEAIRRGQGDAVGSPKYLQELDYHLNQVRNQGNRSRSTQVQNRGLNMKQSRSPVASVRNSGSNSYNYNNRKQQVRLTPEQAEFARINKFNPESYMKRILAQQRKTNNR